MTLTTPMKVILCAVLTGIICLGFFLLDWQKKLNERAALDVAVAAKQQEYDRIRNETRSLTGLVEENARLTREFNLLVHQGTEMGKQEDVSQFVPDFIQKVEDVVADVSGEKGDSFQIVSITPGSPTTGPDTKKKDEAPSVVSSVLERMSRRKFQFQARGRFETLVAFLDKLGALALDRLVTVDKISLSPSGGEKGPHPSLSITLPLTAYLKGGQ